VTHSPAEIQLLKQIGEQQARQQLAISHDIHDGIVQDLVAAKMHLETVETSTAEADQRLKKSIGLLERVLSDCRRLVQELRPLSPGMVDLPSALHRLAAEMQQLWGFVVRLEGLADLQDLPRWICGLAFGIAKEAIINAARHSGTTQALLSVQIVDQRLILVIQDEGVGFDPQQVKADRYGLRGMRERAFLMGGQVSVISQPGQGTRVNVDLPIGAQ
jgi:signal transduction histidine kinase